MFQEQAIPQILSDQTEVFNNKKCGISRNIDIDRLLKSDRIIVLTGIRRSGKSTFLRQIAEKVLDYYYVNFDDERFFDFSIGDFQKLMINLKKLKQAKTILIDEIQNVPGWERFVRRLHDEEYKIFITGSNAKLLSSELSTHLTGRYKKIELFPFSFREFLTFKEIDSSKQGTDNLAQILNAFDEYLLKGGFPEYVKYQDKEDLQSIYNDIIYKDLIVRFRIKNPKAFKNLSLFLMTNVAGEMSYNSLKSTTGISNSNTIKYYIDYLQQAYLLFECYKYDYSLKRQNTYNKKIYSIDNGLRDSIAFRFGSEYGKLLENLIFIELKRRNKEVFFYKTKEGYEVDFLVHDDEPVLILVSYTLADKNTEKREVRALLASMRELNVNNALLITHEEEDVLVFGSLGIYVLPAWKFLTGVEPGRWRS